MNKSTTIDGYEVELDQDGKLWIEKDGRFFGSGAGLENTGTLNDRDGYTPHYVSEVTQDKIFSWELKHIA